VNTVCNAMPDLYNFTGNEICSKLPCSLTIGLTFLWAVDRRQSDLYLLAILEDLDSVTISDGSAATRSSYLSKSLKRSESKTTTGGSRISWHSLTPPLRVVEAFQKPIGPYGLCPQNSKTQMHRSCGNKWRPIVIDKDHRQC
jgi:hypothetical protein